MVIEDILKLIIQPAITIIGWGVGAWWAVRQIHLANQKAIDLQKFLMSENYKRSLAKEFIDIYKDISQSINQLQQAGCQLCINITLEEEISEHVTINASSLVAPVNDAYKELAQNMFRLSMWVRIVENHLTELATLKEGIEYFHKFFSLPSLPSDVDVPNWMSFQKSLFLYQSDNLTSNNNLYEIWDELLTALAKLLELLTQGTSEVNKTLVNDASMLRVNSTI